MTLSYNPPHDSYPHDSSYAVQLLRIPAGPDLWLDTTFFITRRRFIEMVLWMDTMHFVTRKQFIEIVVFIHFWWHSRDPSTTLSPALQKIFVSASSLSCLLKISFCFHAEAEFGILACLDELQQAHFATRHSWLSKSLFNQKA